MSTTEQTAATFYAGQTVNYDTGSEIVEARVFRAVAGKVWIDHRTFSRARVVAANSPRLSMQVAA